jgi:DNA-directed RNA polymerase subunit alpha
MTTLYSTYSQIVKPSRMDVEVSPDGSKGKFTIYPIQRGFGVTLGNSMRRILLSSLRGSVISSVRIQGAEHEFTTLPSVRQDVVQICLNLARVLIKSEHQDCEAQLNVSGVTVVTAGMIQVPAGVEIINKDFVLFEMDAEAKVSMTFKVISGIGYIFHNKTLVEQSLGEIPIDCYFSPVKNVNFSVDNARVDSFTDYDKLHLSVETNGTIRADDAVSLASHILRDFLKVFLNFDDTNLAIGNVDKKKTKDVGYNLNLLRRIDDLELSVRAANCLASAGIYYIGELVARAESEMLRMPNFGRKSLDGLKATLTTMGLAFGMDIGQWPPKNMHELAELAKKQFEN